MKLTKSPLTETVCLRIVYAEFERLHIAVEPIKHTVLLLLLIVNVNIASYFNTQFLPIQLDCPYDVHHIHDLGSMSRRLMRHLGTCSVSYLHISCISHFVSFQFVLHRRADVRSYHDC